MPFAPSVEMELGQHWQDIYMSLTEIIVGVSVVGVAYVMILFLKLRLEIEDENV